MKILAIDDQRIVLLYLKKCLVQLGYEVETTTNGHQGVSMLTSFKPDLVIVDINIPSVSGLLIIKYIRENYSVNVPILVLSGTNDEKVKQEAFNFGADGFLQKPVSLREISVRIKQLLKNPTCIKSHKTLPQEQYIQPNVVGIVIPCYNEEERLKLETFREFLHKNLGYHLCFVNDGSSDGTLDLLNSFKKEFEHSVIVLDQKTNVGKAEAVRLGALSLLENTDIEYIGFLDADLSTDFKDLKKLQDELKRSNNLICSGSRIERMGAQISRKGSRAIISRIVNRLIRLTVKMPFQDTQCGAKIMKRDVVNVAFKQPFYTKWLFDVEIFKRLSKEYGHKYVVKLISEVPLDKWTHMEGSKLSFRDSLSILGQIASIHLKYDVLPLGYITKNKSSIKSESVGERAANDLVEQIQ
ncbi:response regulator [Cytophaga sp. FL35]|uniref:response regulator n=1 Tax=Cytophaga sp. FL35 TaxID=1904456 RepID=UPI001653EBDC|nr:response regulator [Cytophaga sp. FL35]MBC7000739.1 response regulator [Cytophaga sp. FL35]